MITRRPWPSLAGAVLLATVAALAPSIPASAAATIAVTTTVDELNEDGDCSLREAVRAANLDDPVDECAEGDGFDTIRLRAGTFTLSVEDPAPMPAAEDAGLNGDLDITAGVKIEGRGAGRTIISANGIDRVFDVRNGATGLIGRMTVRDGDTLGFASGGGLIVRNTSTATLYEMVFTRNRADANGGALGAETNADLTGSQLTIARNEAGFSGGGVFNNSPDAVFAYTTIRNNHAADNGGGWYSYGGTMTNGTISGNSTDEHGGGAYADSGFLYLLNSTVARNTADDDENAIGTGGGLDWEDVPPSVGHTILADNTDTGGEEPDCSGALTSLGYNLLEDTAGCSFTGNLAGNIVGQDPEIGPLRNNGGATATHALEADSPAIGAGNVIGITNTECQPYDQRGAPRKDCDIGAYERVLCRGVVVNRVGTGKPDTLKGTPGRDGFIGLDREDKMKGRGGADAFCGQSGDDRIVGGSGNDFLDGGPGSDTGRGGRGDDRCARIETKIGPCPRN